MPECDTILAHVVVYLAETKKSVRTYRAYNLVMDTQVLVYGCNMFNDFR